MNEPIEIISRHETPSSQTERWGFKTAEGEVKSAGSFSTVETRFCDKWVRTLRVGGVGTDPEYRRGGYVRAMLEKSLREARERGWAVALLHPFSFSYYRKFGYERIADHLIVDIPIAKLETAPRCPDFVRIRTEKHQRDVLRVYDAFSAGRNILTRRLDADMYPVDTDIRAGVTYLHYDESGEPDAYLKLSKAMELDVNHLCNGVLTVKELAYTSKAALTAALGFIRMFDGEVDSVHFDNIAMSPEVDWAIRHYTHARYRLLPDIMARILDPEALLRANSYPESAGRFTLRVTDEYHVASGAWRVTYAHGQAQIERLDDSAACDLTMDVRPLAMLLYGALTVDADSIAYLDGVTVNGPAEDFLRAFPKRPCGMFEHF